jgi:drug/metabolite transporter (DMT)-like permease
MRDDAAHALTSRERNIAFLLGFLGVVAFAITLPMTRLATARAGHAGLDPVFVTAGRAAVAGLLSVAYLMIVRSPWPNRRQMRDIGLTGLGVVIGFPLFLSLAIRFVDATHASVITGAMPLATAVLAALILRQRASLAFWLLAGFGFLLVLAYAWLAGEDGHGVSAADLLLLLAVLAGTFGYVMGAHVSREIAPERVICWVLVLYLPLTIPVSLLVLPKSPVLASAWIGFAYVSIFSMWLGFFAWYRGLAADPMRVSQVQLVQPFLSMLAAVPILGEPISMMAVLFCLAIMGTVALSRRLR